MICCGRAVWCTGHKRHVALGVIVKHAVSMLFNTCCPLHHILLTLTEHALAYTCSSLVRSLSVRIAHTESVAQHTSVHLLP
jgi:hypothetical protein